MKYLIVGGVAAGASAAARLRRLDENAEIVVFERGPYISYANCGLPYKLGGEIPARESLLVMPEQKFTSWTNVTVHSETEVTAIDRKAKTVSFCKKSGETGFERYDKLLLATGSVPVRPDMPGINDKRVCTLWSIPDMDVIEKSISDGAKKVVVVGAGAIGLECAENLVRRGLDVTIVELAPQILPTLDCEMTGELVSELTKAGVAVRLGRSVNAFESVDGGLDVKLDDGSSLSADFVVLCIGVRPETSLARAAGLELGKRGHVSVDATLRTSDVDIYAAGDSVEVLDPLTGGQTAIALAGPANKQGRIAADNMSGQNKTYDGSFGASVVKVGRLAAASVGFTERRLRQSGIEYRKLYIHPNSSASYYPGGARLDMKLLFGLDGRILGAQAVGAKGADKRIDVIATAMRCGKKAPELAELELCYAPPFNSAKDPVNFAGFVAEDILLGLTHPVFPDTIPVGAVLVDVRQTAEYELGAIKDSINIPLPELRRRIGEIPRGVPVVVLCQVGLRGYLAERILRQNGFDAYNLSGGYLTWKQFAAVEAKPVALAASSGKTEITKKELPKITVDARAMACPGPIIRLKKEVESAGDGDAIRILAPLTFAADLRSWSSATGNSILSVKEEENHIDAIVIKKANVGNAEEKSVSDVVANKASIILFSNDLDKVMAALIVACGMAAQGTEVSLFFTFWGLSVLRKSQPPEVKKGLLAKMFGIMLPRGATRLALSKMHMMGVGTEMMKYVMKTHNVSTVPDLLREAKSLGVKFLACEMAMDVMGLTREELVDVDDVVGVASFVANAKGGATLFV